LKNPVVENFICFQFLLQDQTCQPNKSWTEISFEILIFYIIFENLGIK
jgi:hypothetical protein